jgi:hypothetical protein
MLSTSRLGKWGLLTITVFAGHAQAADIGTAFTFQGRLVKDGTPVTSSAPHCDFTFGLFDVPAGGSGVGASPQALTGVEVTDGLFAVTIDFGPAGFNGTARWLEITVQCPGDAMPVTLAPRKELTPTPHALALPGLYTQQNSVSPNVIGGFIGNTVTPGVTGATISGGGTLFGANFVYNTYGTVGGGVANRAGDSQVDPLEQYSATVGGGNGNAALARYSTACGGAGNVAEGESSTVAGGITNRAVGVKSAVSGGDNNQALGDQAAIGGGSMNWAGGRHSTVGGGAFNTASGFHATVGGGGGGFFPGPGNTASGDGSTVGGGVRNAASGQRSTVSGGQDNAASTDRSTVGGGENNTASGQYSTIPGGTSNLAGGDYSFAAGQRAKANHNGTFVWADSTNSDFATTASNQFRVRASGGTQIYSNGAATIGVQLAAGGNSWSAVSDRNVKENISAIEPREILSRLASIPIGKWNLKSQNPEIRHIGPMAQDFHAAFGVGESDTHISTSDADGVALAAIQGLYSIVQERECEIDELREQNAELSRRNSELETRIARIEQSIAAGRISENGGGR